jgi:hypothetical protein
VQEGGTGKNQPQQQRDDRYVHDQRDDPLESGHPRAGADVLLCLGPHAAQPGRVREAVPIDSTNLD